VLKPAAIGAVQQPLDTEELVTHSLKEDVGGAQDEIDRMADQAVKQSERMFEEMLRPLLKITDGAEDLETLREALKDEKEIKKLYEQMDSPELADTLRQALYLSELIGRSET